MRDNPQLSQLVSAGLLAPVAEPWTLTDDHVAAALSIKGLPTHLHDVVASSLRRAYRQVYRAVAFDVDGTLTGPSGESLDPEIAVQIGLLLRRGVPVVLITGRGRAGARAAVQELWAAAGLDDLSAEESAQIQRRLRCITHNGVYLLEAGDQDSDQLLASSSRIEAPHPAVRRWHADIRRLLQDVDGLEAGRWSMEPEPEPGGVRIRFDSDEQRSLATPSIEDWISSVGVPDLKLTLGTYQGNAMIDVGTADKGRAVAFAANHLDVRPEAVLRVGDQGDAQGNDFSLLANVAGFSVDRLSDDPETCHPILDNSGQQATGAEAVRLLLSRIHLFPRMMIRPADWQRYARRLAAFERTATRHSQTQHGMLIRQVSLRLQSLLAHRPDGDLAEVRLGDLFDPRSGAVRLSDWEANSLTDEDSDTDPGFSHLFGLDFLHRQVDGDRGGKWCMYSDSSVLLRGPAYYRSLSGARGIEAAPSALREWADFADQAVEVFRQLTDRPGDPTLLQVKCVLGVMDNVRNALIQALVIALVLDGEKVTGALTAARELVRDAALPHTRLHLRLMLDPSTPWHPALADYIGVLQRAASALRSTQEVLESEVKPLRPDSREPSEVELFKWREADHMLENIAAVEIGLRRLIPTQGSERPPLAIGLAYGGVELPLLAVALGERAGRPVRPALVRVSMYSNMEEGRRLRDVVLAATDDYLRLLDEQAPFLSVDPMDIGDEGAVSLEGEQVLLLDDNATTATTLQVARDLVLYRGGHALGACLVRFPSHNRAAHMALDGHGALDLDLVFTVVWGLVAASPYSRLVVRGQDSHVYEDENGVFDKAKQRIKYLLRKNDPGNPYLSNIMPQSRPVPPRQRPEN